MENRKVDILNTFFAEKRQEVPDNGFTQKVILQLPVVRRNHIIIGLFTYLGIILSSIFALNSGFIENVFLLLKAIPAIYFIGAISLIPFIYFCGILIFSRNTRFGLI